MSGNINSFNVGGTLYGLEAETLGSPAGIDGLPFDGGDSVTRYAVCSTAASTAAKTVSLGTEFTVAAGATVYVKFTNANTASSPTLNVNSSGAYPIRQTGSVAAGSGSWAAGEILALVFDGTYWIIFGKAVGNSTTYGVVKVDTAPTQNSTNAVSSGGVFVALSGKQDTLTFDNSPIAGSSNPVKSGGIYTALAKKANLDAYPHDSVASSAVASFTDGADNIPVRSIIAQIVPVQAGSGDPSPDNVRAISGWTGANITRCGKNLFNGSYVGAAIIEESGSYLFNSNLTAARTAIVRVVGGATYAVKKWETSNRLVVCSCDHYPANGDVLTRLSADITLTEVSVTIPAGDMYLLVFVSTRTESATPKMQIEAGETATAYQAYTGNTYNVAFPAGAGTVYGGTLRDNGDDTWTLTATSVSVNMGEATWVKSGTGTYFYTQAVKGLVAVNEGICSVYAISNQPASQMPDAHFRVDTSSGSAGIVYVKDSRYESAADLKTGLSGQIMVLPLSEPDSYPIEASSVTTLLGDNNIFADTGDVSVDYRADTTLYIANEIAASVTDAIEGAY